MCSPYDIVSEYWFTCLSAHLWKFRETKSEFGNTPDSYGMLQKKLFYHDLVYSTTDNTAHSMPTHEDSRRCIHRTYAQLRQGFENAAESNEPSGPAVILQKLQINSSIEPWRGRSSCWHGPLASNLNPLQSPAWSAVSDKIFNRFIAVKSTIQYAVHSLETRTMASAMLAFSALGGARRVPASVSRYKVVESAQNKRFDGKRSSSALIPPGPNRQVK